jgi:hypothetical protein
MRHSSRATIRTSGCYNCNTACYMAGCNATPSQLVNRAASGTTRQLHTRSALRRGDPRHALTRLGADGTGETLPRRNRNKKGICDSIIIPMASERPVLMPQFAPKALSMVGKMPLQRDFPQLFAQLTHPLASRPRRSATVENPGARIAAEGQLSHFRRQKPGLGRPYCNLASETLWPWATRGASSGCSPGGNASLGR